MKSDSDVQLLDLMALNATAQVGSVIFRRLMEHFGATRKILEASEEELRRVEGIGSVTARKIKNAYKEKEPEKEWKRAKALGIKIIPCTSEEFPAGLKKIHDPPIVLYVRGEIRSGDSLAVAIVGTRRATFYGKQQSESLAYGLASAGFTIISGLAAGIDTFAHRGALKAKGRTIAVCGRGLADIYPPENGKLAEEIAASGALISEFPLDFPPMAENFPRRNRLIAGLALGAVVVEANFRSGALITANWALEQDKEVFAVPGKVDSHTSRGCHRLIKEGAKLVEDVGDVIDELGPLAEGIVFEDKEGITGAERNIRLSENERKVYEVLSSDEMDIEEIIRAAGLPANVVSGALSLLCLKRLAVPLAGQRYAKAKGKQ